jgi:acyl-[acyl-carrier-protein]-phospholipid O-acyltransferase/long-chain-fatty-acid--[acyl-carrier-protein] ligase
MSIMKSQRFFPLFMTQFLGAFNDNLFKNAMVMLITFSFAAEGHTGGMSSAMLVTVAAGVFILPFFLFSATAGQFADKHDKAKLARIIKQAEILFMTMAAAAFIAKSIWMLMLVLFCMGAQSAFFGPIKYAILPQHLGKEELLKGNAYVEAGTFLAILAGTILGGLLVMNQTYGIWVISAGVIAVAITGYFFSRGIPAAPGPSPDLKINPRFWTETQKMMKDTQQNVVVYRAILAISWFWLVGATYLTQFPSFAKYFLGGDESVVTLLLALFSIGIGFGSVMCEKLLKGRVQLTYVPLAAIGMALFGVDLYFATGAVHVPETAAGAEPALVSALSFASGWAGWRVMLDLFFIAVCGGMFVVPLYAMVQTRAEEGMVARTIAGLNVMNSLFMVTSALVCAILLKLSVTIPGIFLVMALCNILVAVYISHLLPEDLMRSLIRAILTWAYKVEVKGLENFDAAGKRVLIVANHTSFLDAVLIAAYLPVKITFAINTHVSKKWWIKPFLSLVDAFPLDPTNPMAIKKLVELVREDKIAMIFPEGRITVTGSLMKVYEGPGLIADKAGAKLLPIRIDGAQYSPFSRLRGKVTIRAFPKITLTILPPCDFQLPEDAMGRRRRQLAAAKLYDIMSGMMFEASDTHETLLKALLKARRLHGGRHVVAEDPTRTPMHYRDVISRAMTLGRVMSRHLPNVSESNNDVPAVGVLLPNMTGTVLTFFALHAIRRTPAMLNFSSGPAQIVSACKTANMQVVITSRRFIEMGKLDAVTKAIEEAGVTFLYLEDLAKKVDFKDKLYGLTARYVPELLDKLQKPKAQPDDAAVILFTSGSEGTPKGVVLSHRNIRANCHQIGSRIDFGPTDIVFNCLPMFHSFGLTGGTLLPILSGLRTFYYPSPLHYRIVPELIYDTNATILFGTDTFLSGYARFAHPYDFHAIRYVFAGAEKLKEETRRIYAEKYGVRIFEGYGATETAPVISINTPMHNRPGTVGRFLPGITYKLERVEGLEPDQGKLVIHGPNIMKGYLKSDAPGVLQPPEGGWYDTGDIVAVDDRGFIAIQGRLKRFAKIGGEMVSLTAVEGALQKMWPEALHAVVSVKDDKKGEKLILFTTQTDAKAEDITQYFRRQGINELSIPKQIEIVADLPLLGTGKLDYMTLQKTANER